MAWRAARLLLAATKTPWKLMSNRIHDCRERDGAGPSHIHGDRNGCLAWVERETMIYSKFGLLAPLQRRISGVPSVLLQAGALFTSRLFYPCSLRQPSEAGKLGIVVILLPSCRMKPAFAWITEMFLSTSLKLTGLAVSSEGAGPPRAGLCFVLSSCSALEGLFLTASLRGLL